MSRQALCTAAVYVLPFAGNAFERIALREKV